MVARYRPHDDGVLTCLVVVARTDASRLEAKRRVERQRSVVPGAHLKRHPRDTAVGGLTGSPEHQGGSDSGAARVGGDRKIEHVRAIGSDHEAAESEKNAALFDDQPLTIVRPGEFVLEEPTRPRRRERIRFDTQHRIEIVNGHPADDAHDAPPGGPATPLPGVAQFRRVSASSASDSRV